MSHCLSGVMLAIHDTASTMSRDESSGPALLAGAGQKHSLLAPAASLRASAVNRRCWTTAWTAGAALAAAGHARLSQAAVRRQHLGLCSCRPHAAATAGQTCPMRAPLLQVRTQAAVSNQLQHMPAHFNASVALCRPELQAWARGQI